MKRSMKCLITFIVVAFIIVPILEVVSNSRGVYAARTVVTYSEREIYGKYNSKTERIGSVTEMVRYQVSYSTSFSLPKNRPLDLWVGRTLTGTTTNNGTRVNVTVSSCVTNSYKDRSGKYYPYTNGSLSATYTTGWFNVYSRVSAPSISVSYGNKYGSFYKVMKPASYRVIQRKYIYNIVPISNTPYTYKGISKNINTSTSNSTTIANSSAKTTTTTANKNTVSYISISDDAKRLFVRSLYKNVLKREASNADIDAHYKKPAEKIASDIMLSKEAEQKNGFSKMSNQEFVKYVYRYILGREADSGGLKNNTAILNSGKSRQSLIQGFVGSAEFKSKRVIATRRITTLNDALTKAVCIDLHDQGYDALKPSTSTLLMYEKDVAKITTLNLKGKGAKNYDGLNKVFPKLKTIKK